MTVVQSDRVQMAESDDELILDEMFERLERMPIPEGYRVDIVEGAVHMSPQRDAHWQIIRRIVRQLEDAFGIDVNVTSDVRIDFPGHLNGFCPDVAKFHDGSRQDARGRWRHQDVAFVAEVISRDTAANDYGPKKKAYAIAGVPVYLIVDPYQGKCHAYTAPKDGDYRDESAVSFGLSVDLSPMDLTLITKDFPKDR